MHSSEFRTSVDYSGNKSIQERRQNGSDWKLENISLSYKILIFFFHEFQVIFDAFKKRGPSDIALDDIGLTKGKCNESNYVEPTVIPVVTTVPSVPSK